MEMLCPMMLIWSLTSLSTQAIYKQFDVDRSGTIGSSELPGAFEAAGMAGGHIVGLGVGLVRQPH